LELRSENYPSDHQQGNDCGSKPRIHYFKEYYTAGLIDVRGKGDSKPYTGWKEPNAKSTIPLTGCTRTGKQIQQRKLKPDREEWLDRCDRGSWVEGHSLHFSERRVAQALCISVNR
jgi:hypothetical protein